jgi:tetratricopeptide (TPR) repeat protein
MACRYLLAILGIITSVSLAFGDAVQDCDQDKDADRAIRGCSEYISTAQITAQQRSIAYVKRALAYTKKAQIEAAIADYDESVRLDPKQARAYWLRALLYRFQRRYAKALGDVDQAIAVVNAAQASHPADANKRQLEQFQEYRDEITLDLQMESRWIEYLKQIQTDNEHPNWSAPPYDLYKSNRPRE